MRQFNATDSTDGGQMIMRSPLHGRRVHITGSVSCDLAVASAEEVKASRLFVEAVVCDLMKKGAGFVVPVDAEKHRPIDNQPICFDWLIWETLSANLARRPSGAPDPLAIAVQHHKSEDQIPEDKFAIWDAFRGSELVSIDNASSWNMASKRMEIQANHGDILITLGGSEGVLFLANIYHQAGKPIIPLNFKLCASDTGSRKLFSQALLSQETRRFFRTEGQTTAHDWINRLNFSQRHNNTHRVNEVLGLLEALQKPTVFAVRLLNSSAADFHEVETFFTGVVKHVVEQELGYIMKVVDGLQPFDYPRIDTEIFNRLHHASVVVADITGVRPNCFIELGYALGRGTPTMLTAKKGTESPFDVKTIPEYPWNPSDSLTTQRNEFRAYWTANINRPPLVSLEPLIP